jgi:hypothetical protein
MPLPLNMTLFVQPQESNSYLMATVLDRGPDCYDWIKVQLPNGDEAFCYSDTDLTINIKSLQPGTRIAISAPRPCNKPGTTKWTCNSLHINLQSPEIFKYHQNQDTFDEDPDNFELCAPVKESSKKRSKPSASVPYSLARYQFIEKVIQQKGFEGKYAKSEAVGYIVDSCMTSGVLQ